MEILILGLLILLNGFFALAEIALVSSKKARLEQFRLKKLKGAQTALKLLRSSEGFLSAIQVGITLIGIVTGVYGGIKIADDVAPFFLLFESTKAYAYEIALTVTIILITYVSIVIGELVPKTIALSNPEKIAVRVAPAIYWFSTLFYPFVKILSWSTELVNKIIGIKNKPVLFTEAELRQIIKTASYEGVIQKSQNLMHERVFYFADKKAKHIMTHRTEVEWIDLKETDEQIYQSILSTKHSKVIAGDESLDDFTGILSVKEYLLRRNSGNDFSIKELLIDPLIVPENTGAQKVLDLFRTRHQYFAVVVSEYGSFEGIITLHDIMENLVGSIPEEGENVEPDIFIREDKSVLVSGSAPVETLSQLIEDFVTDFETMDYSTVAGFAFAQLNKIPQIGDKFEFANHEFEIVDIDGNRIDKILIQKKR